MCYPGFHAILFYRLSRKLWRWGLKLPARMVSQTGRFFTGVEIHPAANIGRNLFIDHGMGVVIGETAKIGDDVTIYHGVTLGGTSWSSGIRHPQIGNRVIIGSGAQLLGPITVGDDARVGSNAVVVKDVPPAATVVGVPANEVVMTCEVIDNDSDNNTSEGTGEDDGCFDAYGIHQGQIENPVEAKLEAKLEEALKELSKLNQRVKELEAQNANIEITAASWKNY